MDETESKLAAWATKHGINYARARRQMTSECPGAFAAQLRYARESKAPAEVECALLCLRLMAAR